jgi:hypothetical protein
VHSLHRILGQFMPQVQIAPDLQPVAGMLWFGMVIVTTSLEYKKRRYHHENRKKGIIGGIGALFAYAHGRGIRTGRRGRRTGGGNQAPEA